MKKRDDIQTFHNSARIAVGGSTRILTPPQMSTQNVSSSAPPSQYQILDVLQNAAGGNITQTQNIQYTYSSPAISAASNMQKGNVVQQNPQNQTVHVVNAANINISNRTKTSSNSSGATIQPPSPAGAATIQTPISGQNFPRLKVEDALSYLDQVRI